MTPEASDGLREALEGLADKWDSADYAIAEVNNPILPQEQCAIELRAALAAHPVGLSGTTVEDKTSMATAPIYPHPCELCSKQIESQEDLDWHGLGNCSPICELCNGSGVEPVQEIKQ